MKKKKMKEEKKEIVEAEFVPQGRFIIKIRVIQT